MLRHFTLLPVVVNGKRRFKLLGPTGIAVLAFDLFCAALAKKHSSNTLLAYSRHVAEFLDYLYEAVLRLSQRAKGVQLSQAVLRDIIESYHDYLLYGEKSGNRIARVVAATKPSPCVSLASSSVKHAAIRKFLKLSDQFSREMAEHFEVGLLAPDAEAVFIKQSPLLPVFNTRVKPHQHQWQAMRAESLVAAVVSGGPQLVPKAEVASVPTETYYEEERMFPLESIAKLIDAASSFRDKANYSLLAASGCRAHEGLQLLWEDVDPERAAVRLVSPTRRPNHTSYLALMPEERAQLSWKGRTTEVTLLIEPFRSMFFDALLEYRRREYIVQPHCSFVFQYMRPAGHGLPAALRPYFLSAASSRAETFHRTLVASGVEAPVHGVHSLRHSYGTYCLNYFPRMGGTFGLELPLVQQMLGHAELKSTKKYARQDQDLLDAELAYSNRYVFGGVAPVPIQQLKVAAAEAQLLEFRAQALASGTADGAVHD